MNNIGFLIVRSFLTLVLGLLIDLILLFIFNSTFKIISGCNVSSFFLPLEEFSPKPITEGAVQIVSTELCDRWKPFEFIVDSVLLIISIFSGFLINKKFFKEAESSI